MSANWQRYFDLRLTDCGGTTLILSDIRVLFTITAGLDKKGAEATIVIYNLSKTTQNKLLMGHYQQVKILAGYRGQIDNNGAAPSVVSGPDNVSVIFSGEIRYAFSGMTEDISKMFGVKADARDALLSLHAIDGHKALLESRMNTTLAAGYDIKALHALTMKNFNPFGITAGATGTMPSAKFPRGRVLYKLAYQVMDDVAAQCRASWQFFDGKLQLVPEENYLEQQVVLNRQTGMIGVPIQAKENVIIKCLINRDIYLHGLVQIKSGKPPQKTYISKAQQAEEAKKAEATTSKSGAAGELQPTEQAQRPAAIASDGVYIVKAIRYTGDTRGSIWYMDLTCVPRDSQTALTTGAAPAAAKN